MAGPGSSILPPTLARKRPPPTGDEEATLQLKLGDMTDVYALSVAEANELLTKLEEARGRPSNSDIYVKTKDYVETFARFKDSSVVGQVDTLTTRLMSSNPQIKVFERAQLATLCCDTAEEARTLIPSLEGKINDEDLQQVLDDISKLRDFS